MQRKLLFVFGTLAVAIWSLVHAQEKTDKLL